MTRRRDVACTGSVSIVGNPLIAVAALGLLLATTGSARADIIYVPGDHPTIQLAIEAAVNGDTVLIADGTYAGAGNRNLDFGGRAITVRSANGPAQCTIDCEQAGRGFFFHSGEGPSAILEGLTITNGLAGTGGGVFCFGASPTIVDCVLVANVATSALGYEGGGGITCRNSGATIAGCVFKQNQAIQGGGVFTYYGAPVIENCTFDENTGIRGGGLYAAGNMTPIAITACAFIRNFADEGGGFYYGGNVPTPTDCTFTANTAAQHGGAVYCTTGDTEFSSCTFTGNAAAWGGAVRSAGYGTAPVFTDCSFAGNSAIDGGAVWCSNSSTMSMTDTYLIGNVAEQGLGGAVNADAADPAMLNCAITGNLAVNGGAVCSVGGSPMIINSTIARNVATGEGGAINCVGGGAPMVANSILWGDWPEEIHLGSSALDVTYSLVAGSLVWPGEGNINADPLMPIMVTGAWTAGGVYDAALCRITLIDAGAAWSEDAWAGFAINPDIDQGLEFLIISNTATTLTVFAERATIDAGASWIDSGMTYRICDVRPDAGSPCIDAGDSVAVPPGISTDLGGNPRFVDDPATPDTGIGFPCVDMGAFEFQVGAPCPADVNADGYVDVLDLLAVLAAWGATAGPEDINGDGVVDVLDLLELLAAWGPC